MTKGASYPGATGVEGNRKDKNVTLAGELEKGKGQTASEIKVKMYVAGKVKIEMV